MSKAFKEDADGSAEVLPDRDMSPHANLVTAGGLAQIDATIAKLQKDQANSSEGDAPSVARDFDIGPRRAPRRNSPQIPTHRR